MAHAPAKGRVGVTIKGPAVGKKVEYYSDDRYQRLIKVERIVDVPQSENESKTKELKDFVGRELKKGDRILAQPYASFLSAGAEFVLMDEKGRYELLLSGVFTPDDKNAYGNLSVSGLKITEKLSGPRRALNYLKAL